MVEEEMKTEADPTTVPVAKTEPNRKAKTKPVKKLAATKKKAARARSSALPAKKAKKAKKPPATAKRTAAKKKAAKKGRPRHWTDTHAQLVMHATPELVAKLDRKLEALGRALKLEPNTRGKRSGRITRGQVIRALVEKACR